MVDVTYQMVLSTLQTAGLLVGIYYYLTVLRNTQKARHIEMLQRLHETKYDVEGVHQYFTLMAWKWEDFDDYMQRYGGRNNPDTSSIMESQMSYLDGLGVLVINNVVDLETVYEISGRRIISYWMKFETVIKGLRSAVGFGPGSDYCDNLEFLANEMIKIRKSKGQSFPLHDIHSTSTLNKELF